MTIIRTSFTASAPLSGLKKPLLQIGNSTAQRTAASLALAPCASASRASISRDTVACASRKWSTCPLRSLICIGMGWANSNYFIWQAARHGGMRLSKVVHLPLKLFYLLAKDGSGMHSAARERCALPQLGKSHQGSKPNSPAAHLLFQPLGFVRSIRQLA